MKDSDTRETQCETRKEKGSKKSEDGENYKEMSQSAKRKTVIMASNYKVPTF